MLFNRGPAQSLMQFLKEEVTRFANDHLAPSHWGLGGGAVLATYLPLKVTQREGHEAGCLRALCISPNMLCVCLLKTPFRAAWVSSYYPSLHLDLF